MTTQPDPQLAAAVDAIYHGPTAYRDPTEPPAYGPTPPVTQPGAPPMSQRTAEIMRAVMFGSLATVPPGLLAIGVLVASQHADPTVIGMICAAPAAVAVPILALARLASRAKEAVQAAPVQQHFHGTVHQDQRNVTSKTTGLWAKTTNEQ